MKFLRLIVPGVSLLLGGCSTLSSVNWSSTLPWNWFGSSLVVSDQGVGGLTSTTLMNDEAISDGLHHAYHLRSGMKTDNGHIVRYYEALTDKSLMLVISGENGTVSQVEVLDGAIKTTEGVKPGTLFSELYNKAYGACDKGHGDDSEAVVCNAPGSQHIRYVFTGQWHGPEDLIPSDDTLRSWKLTKIIWHR